MNTLIFTTLIKNAQCDTGKDLDQVGFSASTVHFNVDFYGNKKNNYDLEINQFGYGEQGNFTHVEPTTRQREMMQKMIIDMANEVQSIIDEENKPISYKDFCDDRYRD